MKQGLSIPLSVSPPRGWASGILRPPDAALIDGASLIEIGGHQITFSAQPVFAMASDDTILIDGAAIKFD